MAKAIFFVIVYSAFLLGLFCIFAYLLSTLRPRPLSNVTLLGDDDDDDLLGGLFPTRKRRSKFDETTEYGKLDKHTTDNIHMAMLPAPSYDTHMLTGGNTTGKRVKDRNKGKGIDPEHFVESVRKSGIDDVQIQTIGNESIVIKVLDYAGNSRVEIKINNHKPKKSRKLRDSSRQKYEMDIEKSSYLGTNTLNHTLEPIVPPEITSKEDNYTTIKELSPTTTNTEVTDSSEVVSETYYITTPTEDFVTSDDTKMWTDEVKMTSEDAVMPTEQVNTAEETLTLTEDTTSIYEVQTAVEDVTENEILDNSLVRREIRNITKDDDLSGVNKITRFITN